MKIKDVKVIEIAITRLPGIKRFIRQYTTTGPLDTYGEYAENRAMWTGGGEIILPIVIIETNDGIKGYGFCGGFTSASGKVIIENHFKNFLIGSDPFDTELIWDKLYKASIVFGQKGAAIEAISGVDTALWDIKGKALGVPVYKLLGGKTRDSIKAYASNLHPSDIANPDYDILALEAEEYVHQGFTGLKQRMCSGPREGRKGMEKNERLVKTVREAVGDGIELMVEVYMAWNDITYATEMIRRLQKYNLSWVEEPLMPNNYEGYKLLKSKVDVNIAAGEHEFTRFGAKDLIVNNIVDIIQLDPRRMGGITEGKKVAALAEAFGVEFAPHIAYPETLHLTMACPYIKWAEVTAVPSWEKNKGELSGYIV